MKNNLITTRLLLRPLCLDDVSFIFELVNTPNWIKFIGDRNVHSDADATQYIEKIFANPDAHYKIVYLKETAQPIGVITLIKRHYLDHHDIGFAFLPNYAKKGYAFEAAKTVLAAIIAEKTHTQILATTLKDNVNSIRLLKKLGLTYQKDILVGDDKLMIFAILLVSQ
ncbi:MAG: GNAT family N-acetyltransferase [Saprospiraceae bacterium]|nr:GNAT family N-acetyltransferase [Saprospiraceae bacterium]